MTRATSDTREILIRIGSSFFKRCHYTTSSIENSPGRLGPFCRPPLPLLVCADAGTDCLNHCAPGSAADGGVADLHPLPQDGRPPAAVAGAAVDHSGHLLGRAGAADLRRAHARRAPGVDGRRFRGGRAPRRPPASPPPLFAPPRGAGFPPPTP